MAYPTITTGSIMDASASLLNDTAKSRFTYTVQLPYLNIALQELQEMFELNEIPITDTTSTALTVAAGLDHISFTAQGALVLPSDFVEPQYLWERTTGINPYIPMSKVDVLPRYLEGTTIPQFMFYTWESQEIRFFPASQSNDIKMDYTKNLFVTVSNVNGTDTISVINAQTFLEYRNAGLLAEFNDENNSRAGALNNAAMLAVDRALGIGTKGRQNIMVRRKPFRAGYKRRSYM